MIRLIARGYDIKLSRGVVHADEPLPGLAGYIKQRFDELEGAATDPEDATSHFITAVCNILQIGDDKIIVLEREKATRRTNETDNNKGRV